MELVLRHEKNELCIDHQEGYIGFTVLTEDGKQLDFGIEIDEWTQLKSFIDDSVYEYNAKLRAEEQKENPTK